jgi:protein-tyrosine phosphatase
LYGLAEIDDLPKPWHYEFWEADVDAESLPFSLSHLGEPMKQQNDQQSQEDRQQQQQIVTEDQGPTPTQPIVPIQQTISEVQRSDQTYLALELMERILMKYKNPSSPPSTASSDCEWEYYEDSEEEEEEEKETVTKDVEEMGLKVNSAKEWKELSAKVESEDIKNGMDTSEAVEVESSKEMKSFEPTTTTQLNLICWRTKPWKDKKPSRLFSSQFAIAWKVDCDEVYPNLFIGDQDAARSVKFLKHLKITHVLNTAEGNDDNLVNLSVEHYEGSGIEYKGFLMWDSSWFDVSPFIDEATAFIGNAIDSGGKCLVNCQMGVSRSCTCAMAYMMMAKGWTALEALKQFRANRDVRPNDGFIKYLVDLDNRLRKKREGLTSDD